ncbi:hypothetical protein D082_60210 (plasmid) [Synechocystis sp. PCC 6714]|nr:hypothetical protein D082_60210 [Synechocystis sp. PCC 6714]
MSCRQTKEAEAEQTLMATTKMLTSHHNLCFLLITFLRGSQQ